MMPMLAYNLSVPATPTNSPSAQPFVQLNTYNMLMHMERSPSGTQKNGSLGVKTGRMLTDFVP